MFHNLVAASKILISVQKQSQSFRMRRSLVCSFAFFFLAIVSEETTWSQEIPTRSKVEEIEQELDKVFHRHCHYLKRSSFQLYIFRYAYIGHTTFSHIPMLKCHHNSLSKLLAKHNNYVPFDKSNPGSLISSKIVFHVFIGGDRKQETSCCCSACLS